MIWTIWRYVHVWMYTVQLKEHVLLCECAIHVCVQCIDVQWYV